MIDRKTIMLLEPMNPRDEIIPNLWVGQHPHGENLSMFKYVFCFNPRPLYEIKNWQTCIVSPFEDENRLPPEEFLHHNAEMVADCILKGPTLVHCTAGINRSALIAGLAMVKRGWNPIDAIVQLRAKRANCLLANEVFEGWLLRQTK